MMVNLLRRAGAIALAVGGACAPSAGRPAPPVPPPAPTRAASPPYNAADVEFMSGMIDHHAQAIMMAGWAPSHGASASVRALCERIVVGQRDEIAFMQRWLRERGLPVPAGDPHGHMMAGMDQPMLMPGMLTAAQLAELDAARGPDFDRVFLKDMIQHHQGAIAMVNQLFSVNGSTLDDLIFKYASDVNVDQTTEINRMGRMLAALSSGERSP